MTAHPTSNGHDYPAIARMLTDALGLAEPPVAVSFTESLAAMEDGGPR